MTTAGPWPFYVSYSWETESLEPIVARMEDDAKGFPKMTLNRDTTRCDPGDSIKAFLKEVGEAPRLILVLSKAYFQSRYTLEEFAVALRHGALITRIRVVLVGDFRLDLLLKQQDRLQRRIDELGLDFKLEDFQDSLDLLADRLVHIDKATKETDFKPVLQSILESYQQYPNPEIDDEEGIISLRATELASIKREMNCLFEESDELQGLADGIRNKAAQKEMPGKIGDLLCPVKTGDDQEFAFHNFFNPVLRDHLNSCRRQRKITGRLLDDCLQVVGWIATSFVNDRWIAEHGISITDPQCVEPTRLTLADDNGHLVELVVARSHKRQAQFEKIDQADFASRSGLVFHEPESANASLLFIFQRLMKRFIPERDCNEMNDNRWSELDTRIKLRRDEDNIFVAFNFLDKWGDIPSKLADKLHCLPQFWLGSEDDSGKLFLLAEPKITALIGESIRKIEDYRQYVDTTGPDKI